MKVRKSTINGRLENEIDNLVATLFVEFGLDVRKMEVTYYDDEIGDMVKHIFICGDDMNCFSEENEGSLLDNTNT